VHIESYVLRKGGVSCESKLRYMARVWRNADPGHMVGVAWSRKQKFEPWENGPERQLRAQIER
jgi:hypothetical protein